MPTDIFGRDSDRGTTVLRQAEGKAWMTESSPGMTGEVKGMVTGMTKPGLGGFRHYSIFIRVILKTNRTFNDLHIAICQ